MVSGRPNSIEEARIKLESYCAYQDRCTQDVYLKLEKWDLPAKDTDSIIEDLRKAGFLDDRRFAESYVSGKIRIKKWGRYKILAGLRQKGLGKEIIHEALKGIDNELYQENLSRLLDHKASTLKGDQYTVKVKLFRYLAGKGYEQDLVTDALNNHFSRE